jgi:dTDP-4-amino-4,6-dideoxygalactose transaminase
MNEVSAAMGLTNLTSMGHFISVNQRHYEQYRGELELVEGVNIFGYDENEKSNYQYVVIEVDVSKTLIDRDQLVDLLHRENVLARRYFYPGCHRMEPYRSLYPEADGSLPVTNAVASRVICLPTGTGVTSNEISTICELLRFAIQNGAELSRRLDTPSDVVK